MTTNEQKPKGLLRIRYVQVPEDGNTHSDNGLPVLLNWRVDWNFSTLEVSSKEFKGFDSCKKAFKFAEKLKRKHPHAHTKSPGVIAAPNGPCLTEEGKLTMDGGENNDTTGGIPTEVYQDAVNQSQESGQGVEISQNDQGNYNIAPIDNSGQ
jgi:hypothetical protein